MFFIMNLRSFSALILAGLLTLQGDSYARSPSGGILMTRQQVEASEYDQFTGLVDVTTTYGAVRSLVQDVSAYPEWLHGCLESKILSGSISRGNAFIYFVYAAPKLPWYLFMAPRPKKRDMVLRLEWSENSESGKITVSLTSIDPNEENALPNVTIRSSPDLVRVKEITVIWEFEDRGNGVVAIEHRLHIDPDHKGEDLGIINKYAKKLVEESLKNVRKRLPNL